MLSRAQERAHSSGTHLVGCDFSVIQDKDHSTRNFRCDELQLQMLRNAGTHLVGCDFSVIQDKDHSARILQVLLQFVPRPLMPWHIQHPDPALFRPL